MYNYFLQNYNRVTKRLGRENTFLLMVFMAMVVLGWTFWQISSCQLVNYIYYSGRLHGQNPGLFCRIF